VRWRISTSGRRSSTSITSGSPSGWSTPAVTPGYGAHGYFENYEPLTEVTRADSFSGADLRTPVFVRFSTVAGNKGSADLARDVRGFATKFYTREGNWDLVGNIPVFFIQDAIKFPDLIHAAKQEPDRGFPQAQTAHDNFWDFASLMPESTHMLMWIMPDRAIPRSFRFMEASGCIPSGW
jgi:catalase